MGNVGACVSHDPVVDVAPICKLGSNKVNDTWPLYASLDMINCFGFKVLLLQKVFFLANYCIGHMYHGSEYLHVGLLLIHVYCTCG